MSYMYVGSEIIERAIIPLEAWQKTEGPIHFPKFFNQRWRFHFRPSKEIRFEFHKATPLAQVKLELLELASIFRDAFKLCLRDGALLDNMIMFSLHCTGIWRQLLGILKSLHMVVL